MLHSLFQCVITDLTRVSRPSKTQQSTGPPHHGTTQHWTATTQTQLNTACLLLSVYTNAWAVSTFGHKIMSQYLIRSVSDRHLSDKYMCPINMCQINMCQINMCQINMCQINMCQINMCQILYVSDKYVSDVSITFSSSSSSAPPPRNILYRGCWR